MQASECEATVFAKQRSSGICQLITGFRIHNPSEPTETKETDNQLDCTQTNCVIEMNYCHGGMCSQIAFGIRFAAHIK